MNQNTTNPRPTTGQIMAAKLLLKREREGKVTIVIPDRIREIAAIDDEFAEPVQLLRTAEK